MVQVPLSNIKGTGPEGRIVKADIEDYLGRFLSFFLLSQQVFRIYFYAVTSCVMFHLTQNVSQFINIVVVWLQILLLNIKLIILFTLAIV